MASKYPPRMNAPPTAPKIYISYSHRDRKLVEELIVHLRPLEETHGVEIFYDEKVEAGQQWDRELSRNLEQASIVLFPTSADSLQSSWVKSEMQAAIAESETKRVIPILLRPCAWDKTPLARYMALPTGARPVSAWKNRREAFADIAGGIRAVVESLRGERTHAVPARHASAVRRIVIAPDAKHAVSIADADSAAILWDLTTMQPVGSFDHEHDLVGAAIDADGELLATAGVDGTLRLWRMRELSSLTSARIGRGPVAAIQFFRGQVVVASASTIELVDVKGSRRGPVTTIQQGARLWDVAVSEPANAVAAIDRDGKCYVFAFAEESQVRTFVVARSRVNQVNALAVNGRFVACSDSGSLHVFDLEGRVTSLTVGSVPVVGVAPLPDGRNAVAACADGLLRLCDLENGAVVRQIVAGAAGPTAVAVSPDGKYAIWGSAAGTLSSWALDTVVQERLPEGRDRLKLAYLAVLEVPELWRVLEKFDEDTLSGLRSQLSVPPDADLLSYLAERHPQAEPPALWSAWMETLHPTKLVSPTKPA